MLKTIHPERLSESMLQTQYRIQYNRRETTNTENISAIALLLQQHLTVS